MQVYGPGYGVYADEECDGICAVYGFSCCGIVWKRERERDRLGGMECKLIWIILCVEIPWGKLMDYDGSVCSPTILLFF